MGFKIPDNSLVSDQDLLKILDYSINVLLHKVERYRQDKGRSSPHLYKQIKELNVAKEKVTKRLNSQR
jgi:hypothetical protein